MDAVCLSLVERLLLQQHVELQELFVGELLTAAGLQMLLQKGSSLLGLPAELFEHLIALGDQITAADRNVGLIRLLLG